MPAPPDPTPENATPSAPPAPPRRISLNLTAAVAAWALPGLGHLLVGQTARGLVLAVTIGSLWLGGLLIGGISVIDRQHHGAWFLGQMMVGPSLIVNRYHQTLHQRWDRERGSRADLQPPYEPAFGKPHEFGTLYTALAGLLNLLAVIDVASRFREPDDAPPVKRGARPSASPDRAGAP